MTQKKQQMKRCCHYLFNRIAKNKKGLRQSCLPSKGNNKTLNPIVSEGFGASTSAKGV